VLIPIPDDRRMAPPPDPHREPALGPNVRSLTLAVWKEPAAKTQERRGDRSAHHIEGMPGTMSS